MRVCNKQFSAVGWLHCGSYRTSSASCGSDGEADINYVTSAMNRWVQGYIVDHTRRVTIAYLSGPVKIYRRELRMACL